MAACTPAVAIAVPQLLRANFGLMALKGVHFRYSAHLKGTPPPRVGIVHLWRETKSRLQNCGGGDIYRKNL
jgi:hypothetical protein